MDHTILELRNITKKFGTDTVLQGINLTVQKGEFITLLGSSGCGKTTTLRIISGLIKADSGTVLLDGTDITNIEPDKRNVNTVFQNYALFPHMSVEDNIGYGLKIKKKSKSEIKSATKDALSMMQMEEYAKRYPKELSGGQKQRVAIARAIVNNPMVLLLDEPLGALDLRLRRQMQLELKRLQKQLGITFIYITHDQEEALTMSDKVGVMREGIIEQIGTPAEIYDHPDTAYVAEFVGEANILTGTVKIKQKEYFLMETANGIVPVSYNGFEVNEQDKVSAAIRGESILFQVEQMQESNMEAIIEEKSFAGGMLRIVLSLKDGTKLTAGRHGMDMDLPVGRQLHVGWEAKNAVLVESEVHHYARRHETKKE